MTDEAQGVEGGDVSETERERLEDFVDKLAAHHANGEPYLPSEDEIGMLRGIAARRPTDIEEEDWSNPDMKCDQCPNVYFSHMVEVGEECGVPDCEGRIYLHPDPLADAAPTETEEET